MQPGCGPCHQITPELNRLHNASEVQVVVIHNADSEAIQAWVKENRPHFPLALQERFNVSKRYEVFATPFAFLIDEHGVIAARGIVSTKQYLGFVLTRAGRDDKDGDDEAETSQSSPTDLERFQIGPLLNQHHPTHCQPTAPPCQRLHRSWLNLPN
jgi:hypothetical protein